MSRHHSLADLRADIATELRNQTQGARYTDIEIDLAIRRATNYLSEYFWYEDKDTSKTFVNATYQYTYNDPIKDIYRVDFVDSATSPPQIAVDWYEEKNMAGTELYFLENHTDTSTIHVWYERHPTSFPSDLKMNGDINDAVTSIPIHASTNTIDWPATGYLKIDNEVMSYSAITRTTTPETLTVVRAQVDTAPAAHATADSLLSFTNLVEKEIFFDGVRDIAIAYLNRMRIVDAPSSDIGGNITVMREIMDSLRPWIREHRMRSKRPAKAKQGRSRPMRHRKRGVRG
jgi:hypothetical protein|tara:strand:- start:3572 stop:4435 length:864 start_codon:yes stop_codon:yes gene_type:complete